MVMMKKWLWWFASSAALLGGLLDGGLGCGSSQAGAAEVLASDRATNQVLRFDADSGAYLGPLVDNNMATNGGLFLPAAMAYAFGDDLYVTSIDINTGNGSVLRYDAENGAFKGVFATGLLGPSGLHYHAASNSLLVGSLGTGLGDTNMITRLAADGSVRETLAIGPISGRTDMLASPDGTLFVSSFAEEPFFAGSVLKYNYDAQSDSFSDGGVFASDPLLVGANGLAFDASGDLLVASLFGQSVIRFSVEGGVVTGSTTFTNTAYPADVLTTPDGDVLVTSLGNNNPNDPIYQDLLFPGFVNRYDDAGTLLNGPFMAAGLEFQPTSLLFRRGTVALAGDYDGDGQLTAEDLDLLSLAVQQGETDGQYDLNDDSEVNNDDRLVWINDLKKTYLGDSNLDGEFNSSDFVAVFAAGQYEDEVAGNSVWATGDWSGDGEFDTEDFVTAFQAGGYELGPRPAVAAVPEPATMTSGWLAGMILMSMGRMFRVRRGE